jgi:Zn-dependent M28 family amino/carboxypeptidase
MVEMERSAGRAVAAGEEPETACARRIEAHVRELAGAIGERNVFLPRALQAAADYIERTWRDQGYPVSIQTFEAYGERCANLEVSRPGRGTPGAILLIGAHYDTVRGCPGANDNASGVAAMLEIARDFAELAPRLTVRFVAFVNEEPPSFHTGQQGSVVYARAARERGDDIRLMVSLETIGCYLDTPGSQRYPPLFRRFFPDRGNFLGLVSDFRSGRALRRMARTFKRHSDFPLEHVATFRWIPGIAWSDHLSFWRQGYQALMATDTAFYRYRYYHTPDDTPDKLNYPALGRATAALSRCFAAMAEDGP